MTKPRFTPDPLPDGLDPSLASFLQRQFDRMNDWWPKDLEDRVKALEKSYPYIGGTWPIVDYSTVEFNGSATAEQLTQDIYILLFGVPPNVYNSGSNYAELDSLTSTALPVSGQQVHYFEDDGEGTTIAVAGHLLTKTTDGINWSSAIDTGMKANQRTALTKYVGDKWICIGRSPTAVAGGYRIAESSDLSVWTTVVDNNDTTISIGLGDYDGVSKLAFRHIDSGTGISYVNYSLDNGSSWQLSPALPGASSLSNRIDDVRYLNGAWYALGVKVRIWRSTDLVNWTLVLSASSNQFASLVDIAYGDGVYVAVTNGESGNPYFTSTDGINWTNRGAFVNMNPYSIVFDDTERWAAVSGANFKQSADGISWTNNTSYVWSLLDQIHKVRVEA